MQIILKSLSSSEDNLTQMFAARTVENLATVPVGSHIDILATNDVVLQLWAAFLDAKNPNLRKCCIAATFHLCNVNPNLAQAFFDKAADNQVAEALLDSSNKVRQNTLSLLLVPFCESSFQHRAASQVAESNKILGNTLKLVRIGPFHLNCIGLFVLVQPFCGEKRACFSVHACVHHQKFYHLFAERNFWKTYKMISRAR